MPAHPATWTLAACLVLLSLGGETPTLAPSLTVRQEKSWGNRLTAGSWLGPFNNSSLSPHVIWGKQNKHTLYWFPVWYEDNFRNTSVSVGDLQPMADWWPPLLSLLLSWIPSCLHMAPWWRASPSPSLLFAWLQWSLLPRPSTSHRSSWTEK